MFTGLIESVGTVAAVERGEAGLRLRVATGLATELTLGESLAVNGVCLTVVQVDGETAAFDIGPETMRVTALGGLQPAAAVNLERAMQAGARIGGHFVQGHVDATSRVLDVLPEGGCVWLSVALAPENAPYVIAKGAIAVDGISLTIATLDADRFAVQIVPFTWEHTTLATRRAGDLVNLEFDMLGKYAVRAARLAAERRPVTLETRP